jgi:signal transduction histidine kinase
VSLGSEENGLDRKEKEFLLKVESGSKKDIVYVSFKDSGPGIPSDRLSKIFEPFYSTQDKISEVGLGLWVSYRIIKAHGGTIQVKSIPDKGSTFIVTLPLAGKQGDPATP